eukprot:CAMPEP_0185593450 /NCGR_PEP_ID=MMETSP0434-20130131/71515_1 /TAXON_ID=626734 ORGANISM="Favella taraikaensis, Strain Fe Narragansett Bay" /NCGR_SAMPLE_ID=MMETSP0434 /ASSEMBLY_ACC=CAM_ASM_000379 /LENGTH=54 /DNA_ID=CAMNT_0028220033 /DNA_START=1112 /DNA_END=1276 /DNA_ORIENTATION=+
MKDPVTICSGRSYERATIETYFSLQKTRADLMEQEDVKDDDYDYADFFLCPVTS